MFRNFVWGKGVNSCVPAFNCWLLDHSYTGACYRLTQAPLDIGLWCLTYFIKICCIIIVITITVYSSDTLWYGTFDNWPSVKSTVCKVLYWILEQVVPSRLCWSTSFPCHMAGTVSTSMMTSTVGDVDMFKPTTLLKGISIQTNTCLLSAALFIWSS